MPANQYIFRDGDEAISFASVLAGVVKLIKTTADGEQHVYQQLVVAVGIQLDWNKIEGLAGNLGKNGICSNYSYETVDSTRAALAAFRGGNALFTFPATPVKCASAGAVRAGSPSTSTPSPTKPSCRPR